VKPNEDLEYFGEAGDRMQMMFNFQVNQNLFYALASADTRPLTRALMKTKPRPQTGQWGQFLRNHDELDLGRLTDAQRKTVFDAFGPDRSMQLYDRGIRRRLAPMLNGDRRRIELAYSLLFTMPGTPVIRYGDEIGMGDDLDLPERECARTPMQWSTEPHAGFTKAERPLTPVIRDGPYGYEYVNVAKQRRDANSMVNWTERIVRMRKEVPEIGWGDFAILDVGTPAVLGLRYDWLNNSVLTLHNFSAKPLEVQFDPGAGERGNLLVNLLSEDHSRADARGRHCVVLEAYGYRWYRVGGLDYLLVRSEVDVVSMKRVARGSKRTPRSAGARKSRRR
jgi:maltose alpha-D-glucosyltransferase/alpha-amylase